MVNNFRCPKWESKIFDKGNVNTIKRFEISDAEPLVDKNKGTMVEVFNPAKGVDALANESSKQAITKEYALYLTEYPDKNYFMIMI